MQVKNITNTLRQFDFFLNFAFCKNNKLLFVIFNNVITVRSEMWVRDLPHHSCQKIPSKSLGFASWFGKNFLALMVRKIPYSHFLLTVISHFFISRNWMFALDFRIIGYFPLSIELKFWTIFRAKTEATGGLEIGN